MGQHHTAISHYDFFLLFIISLAEIKLFLYGGCVCSLWVSRCSDFTPFSTFHVSLTSDNKHYMHCVCLCNLFYIAYLQLGEKERCLSVWVIIWH